MSNMPEIEAIQTSIKEDRAESKEVLDRLNYCAYESLERNEFGKELIESLKMRLFCVIGINQDNLEYIEGQNDMIRMLLGMIESHKNIIKGEK